MSDRWAIRPTTRPLKWLSATTSLLARRELDDGEVTPVIDWVVPDADQLHVFRRAMGPRLRL